MRRPSYIAIPAVGQGLATYPNNLQHARWKARMNMATTFFLSRFPVICKHVATSWPGLNWQSVLKCLRANLDLNLRWLCRYSPRPSKAVSDMSLRDRRCPEV